MDEVQQQLNAAQSLRNALGPFARAIFVSTRQGNFLCPIEDLYVGAQLRGLGAYGLAELQTFIVFCSATTRLLVLGANIGALAIPLARLCKSVVAVEASPEMFQLLNLNVHLNGVRNCRVLHKAASNRAEKIEFLMNRLNPGGSKRVPMNKHPAYYEDHPKVVQVEAGRVDDLLPDESFDVVLMDIEGSEYFALQGMPRILSGASVLQVEFIPHHLENVAGAKVQDFVALIEPHFSSLCIARKRLVAPREQFLMILSDMYDRGEGDEALIFSKSPPESIRFAEKPAAGNEKSA
jgi:FkbM family methyltransferase